MSADLCVCDYCWLVTLAEKVTILSIRAARCWHDVCHLSVRLSVLRVM